MPETGIDRIKGENYCTVLTGEKKFINQIKKFLNDYPNEVQIIKENKDGSILAHVPSNWFRFVKPPTKRNLTEEQKNIMAQRMKQNRKKTLK